MGVHDTFNTTLPTEPKPKTGFGSPLWGASIFVAVQRSNQTANFCMNERGARFPRFKPVIRQIAVLNGRPTRKAHDQSARGGQRARGRDHKVDRTIFRPMVPWVGAVSRSGIDCVVQPIMTQVRAGHRIPAGSFRRGLFFDLAIKSEPVHFGKVRKVSGAPVKRL